MRSPTPPPVDIETRAKRQLSSTSVNIRQHARKHPRQHRSTGPHLRAPPRSARRRPAGIQQSSTARSAFRISLIQSSARPRAKARPRVARKGAMDVIWNAPRTLQASRPPSARYRTQRNSTLTPISFAAPKVPGLSASVFRPHSIAKRSKCTPRTGIGLRRR